MTTHPTQAVQVSPSKGLLHVTVLRIYGPSGHVKKTDGRRYFVKISVDGESQTTGDGILGSEWDQSLSFDACSSSRVILEVYKRRKLHSDRLIGSVEEGIEALLTEALAGNISRALQSTPSPAYTAYRLDFKVEVEIDQDVAALAAMVQRARIRASRLHGSRVMSDSTVLTVAQPANDVSSLDIIKETWDPLLEKLRIFAKIAESVSEVHPYAKVAYSVVALAYKAVVAQVQRDINILCLIDTMDDIYAFVKEAEPLRKIESHWKVMVSIARQTTECGYFISAYCNDSFLARTVKHSMAPTDTAIVEYGIKFADLKAALLAFVTINTEITVLRVFDTVERLETKIDLNDLPYADGARFQVAKQCLPRTREGILTDIYEWVNTLTPASQRVFILTGKAGTGKSAIAHTVAHHYYHLGRLGSSVFSTALTPAVRDTLPSIIIPTIARDLADLDRHFRHKLWCVIEQNRSLRRTVDPVAQLEDLLLTPFSELSIAGPIVIVIDSAGDSCEQSLDELLMFVIARVKDLPANLRILLTARSDSRLTRHLSENVRCRRMEDIGSASTRRDLVTYARARLHCCDLQELIESSDKSFPWLVSACDTIRSALSASSAFERNQYLSQTPALNRSFPAVPEDPHFFAALSRLFDMRSPHRMSQFKRVMRELLPLFIPLPTSSLVRLRSLSDTVVDEVLQIICRLEGLFVGVIYRVMPIVPIHASFYDFLRDQARSKQFYVDATGCHQPLTMACLRTLRDELLFNICHMPSSHVKNTEVSDLSSRVETYISPQLSYASRFWIEHLVVPPATVTSDILSAVFAFLKDRLFLWLEALSILGCVDVAIEGLPKLIEWCNSTVGVMDLEPVKSVAEAALSFVKMFEPAITLSAPHIYVSALRFGSIEEPIFSQPPVTFSRVYMPSTENHSALWQHEDVIDYIAFSSDSRSVLSCSISGALSKVAVFWHALEWQKQLSHFRYHRPELSSHDETVIVSAGNNSSILNVKTGEEMLGRKLSSALSNGTWIAAVQPGGERFVTRCGPSLVIYDTKSGCRILGPLKVNLDETEGMSCVVLSSCGTFLACGTYRGRILLCDTTAKEPSFMKIKLLKEENYNFVFSLNETCLVAWYGDHIHVRDARTGNSLYNFNASRISSLNQLKTLDISPDGRYLVYGAHTDGLPEIRFIGLERGEMNLVQPLPVHAHSHSEITCIAFSPDGTMVVYGSKDNIVRVCRVAMPFGEHSLWGKGDDSGWILGRNGELLAWVPPELRKGFNWNPQICGEAHGRSWTKCLVVG